MKIIQLMISNYRTYSENQTLDMEPKVNILVGENNIGKSTVLRAINILNGSESIAPKDYHKEERTREVRIEALFELTQTEIDALIRAPELQEVSDHRMTMVRNLFETVKLGFSSRYGLYLPLNGLFFYRDSVTLTRRPRENQGSIKWSQILHQYLTSKASTSLTQIIKGYIGKSASKTSSIDINLPDGLRSLLQKRFHVFAEIRQNPIGENVDVLESYDGRQVADVLFKLKNGNISQRKRWRLIKRSFKQFFPDLALEVGKENRESPPEISIEKPEMEFEVPIKNVGAGIGETIILITHLIASSENIFGLEMPELHFHPHSQRLLKKFLSENSTRNQFIITTHSPLFIDESSLESVILVKNVRDITSILKMPKDYLTPLQKYRAARQLDSSKKELFFSRKVLLVEGETELGAFPIFSAYLEKDFDQLGVSVIKSGKHFGLFAKLLAIYKIPFIVLCDSDALMQIFRNVKYEYKKPDGKKKQVEVKTNAVFYNLWKASMIKKKHLSVLEDFESQIVEGKYQKDAFPKLQRICSEYNVCVLPSTFEEVLTKNPDIQKLFKKAKSLSDSKVIIGRIVADKIMRKKLKLPKEFIEVIQGVEHLR